MLSKRLRWLSDDELILNSRGWADAREVLTNGLACRTKSRTMPWQRGELWTRFWH